MIDYLYKEYHKSQMWFIMINFIFNAHCLTHKVTTAQYNDAHQLITNMCKGKLFHEQIITSLQW